MMELGWTYIVADLHAYLATGVRIRRFMRAWIDFGADTSPSAGGLLVANVNAHGVAASLGLQDDDLLVEISNAPTITLQDLNATLLAQPAPRDATWIRGESLMRSTS